jgi:hypothetical protein
MTLKEGERLAESCCRRGDDAVESELVGHLADALTLCIVTDGGEEVRRSESDLCLSRLGAEVEDLGDIDLTGQNAPRCHQITRHPVIGKGIDQVTVCLDDDRSTWPTQVED